MLDNKTIYRLGQLYHWLEDAVSPKNESGAVIRRNTTDYDNACRFPLKVITMKITMTHKLHVSSPALERAIGNVYADISLDQMQTEFDQCLSLQQQGEFQRGYWSQNYKEALACVVEGMRDARNKARLSIRKLAEVTGLSVSTIRDIENGSKMPKADTLKKIADACGVSVLEIYPKENGND